MSTQRASIGTSQTSTKKSVWCSISLVDTLQALDKAALKPGQRVMVQAGSGGVGSWVVQLAKQRGLHVTATCSTPNVSFVQVLFDHTISKSYQKIGRVHLKFTTESHCEVLLCEARFLRERAVRQGCNSLGVVHLVLAPQRLLSVLPAHQLLMPNLYQKTE